MQSLCYLNLPQLCQGTLYHPSVTRGDPLTAPKRPETRPKPTDFPLSTSNVISVQSYHSKNYYAITMLSRPTSTVSRHTISPICDQGGAPHSPKTARNTPQTNTFSYPGSIGVAYEWLGLDFGFNPPTTLQYLLNKPLMTNWEFSTTF